MARIVMKFGGTSLEGERLERAAQTIAAAWRSGAKTLAVLSARGQETDRLLLQARTLNPEAGGRELDQLLATGEMQSVALCALLLEAMGCPVCSMSGAQAGIRTDGTFGDARITQIDTAPVLRQWDAGKIVLAAGFQGLAPDGSVTTLGRGGSDTTAAALACALGADRCRIYTDVDGVYDRDPRKYPDARKFDRIGYDDMLRLIDGGAQVLHRRSVEIARNCGFELEVLSALHDAPGTVVGA